MFSFIHISNYFINLTEENSDETLYFIVLDCLQATLQSSWPIQFKFVLPKKSRYELLKDNGFLLKITTFCYLFLCTCGCTDVQVYVGGGKGLTSSQLFSTLFFEVMSLTEPRAH